MKKLYGRAGVLKGQPAPEMCPLREYTVLSVITRLLTKKYKGKKGLTPNHFVYLLSVEVIVQSLPFPVTNLLVPSQKVCMAA